MILSDMEIIRRMEFSRGWQNLFIGAPGVADADATDAILPQICPASVDLRLGSRIGKEAPRVVAIGMDGKPSPDADPEWGIPWSDPDMEPWTTRSLRPGESIIAETLEAVRIPRDMAAVVSGKAKLARLGLHVLCGFGNPGWDGPLPLRLANLGPHTLILRPGMLVCQIVLHDITAGAIRGWGDQHDAGRLRAALADLRARHNDGMRRAAEYVGGL